MLDDLFLLHDHMVHGKKYIQNKVVGFIYLKNFSRPGVRPYGVTPVPGAFGAGAGAGALGGALGAIGGTLGCLLCLAAIGALGLFACVIAITAYASKYFD